MGLGHHPSIQRPPRHSARAGKAGPQDYVTQDSASRKRRVKSTPWHRPRGCDGSEAVPCPWAGFVASSPGEGVSVLAEMEAPQLLLERFGVTWGGYCQTGNGEGEADAGEQLGKGLRPCATGSERTFRATWFLVRAALCRAVIPSLARKSRWAPPFRSALITSTGSSS